MRAQIGVGDSEIAKRKKKSSQTNLDSISQPLLRTVQRVFPFGGKRRKIVKIKLFRTRFPSYTIPERCKRWKVGDWLPWFIATVRPTTSNLAKVHVWCINICKILKTNKLLYHRQTRPDQPVEPELEAKGKIKIHTLPRAFGAVWARGNNKKRFTIQSVTRARTANPEVESPRLRTCINAAASPGSPSEWVCHQVDQQVCAPPCSSSTLYRCV